MTLKLDVLRNCFYSLLYLSKLYNHYNFVDNLFFDAVVLIPQISICNTVVQINVLKNFHLITNSILNIIIFPSRKHPLNLNFVPTDPFFSSKHISHHFPIIPFLICHLQDNRPTHCLQNFLLISSQK